MVKQLQVDDIVEVLARDGSQGNLHWKSVGGRWIDPSMRAQSSPPGICWRSLTVESAFLRILMFIISTPREKAIAK